jgi:hypothetical protein
MCLPQPPPTSGLSPRRRRSFSLARVITGVLGASPPFLLFSSPPLQIVGWYLPRSSPWSLRSLCESDLDIFDSAQYSGGEGATSVLHWGVARPSRRGGADLGKSHCGLKREMRCARMAVLLDRFSFFYYQTFLSNYRDGQGWVRLSPTADRYLKIGLRLTLSWTDTSHSTVHDPKRWMELLEIALGTCCLNRTRYKNRQKSQICQFSIVSILQYTLCLFVHICFGRMQLTITKSEI